MQVKVRKTNKDGTVRLETLGELKEILINEDLLHPESESISLCWRGKNSSGIIDVSPSEFLQVYNKIKSRMHLIKGFKRLSSSGAIKL